MCWVQSMLSCIHTNASAHTDAHKHMYACLYTMTNVCIVCTYYVHIYIHILSKPLKLIMIICLWYTYVLNSLVTMAI